MKELLPNELDFNAFNKFGKEWALIVVEDEKEDNAMTIAWGQLGILWSKPVMSVYVRNNRYTKHMLDSVKKFSVCFFDDSYKEKLGICGTKSRSNLDKISECKFTRIKDNSTLYLKEAQYTFILKKIYQIDIPINEYTDISISRHYNENEYHTQYIGEIEKILVNE